MFHAKVLPSGKRTRKSGRLTRHGGAEQTLIARSLHAYGILRPIIVVYDSTGISRQKTKKKPLGPF